MTLKFFSIYHNTNCKVLYLSFGPSKEVVINYVCLSDNIIQDLLISSRLNDFTNCKRRFNVDIMMLYISAMDHARKSKSSSTVHLPSINKMIQ